MSGPKYSTVEVELQRLQKLIQELEEKIERSKVQLLTKQIKDEMRAIELTKAQFRAASVWKESLSLADQYLPDSPDVSAVKHVIQEIDHFSVASAKGKNSTELAQQLAELQREHTRLRGRIALVDTLIQPINQAVEEIIHENNESEFLSNHYERESISKSRMSEKTSQLYFQLLELLAASGRLAEAKQEIDAIVSNPNADDSFKQRHLQLRIDAITSIGDDREEIAALKAQAESLLSLLGKDALELPNTVVDLQQMIKELEAEAKQKAADDYIETSIREVLEEVGYAVVDTQTVRTKGKTTRKQIANVSDHSVLQVASSNTGAVMFEIMSRKASADVTDSDRHAVAADMRAFCPDYQLIKRKLAERGLILTGEVLCEPSEQYVRGSGFGSTSSSSSRRKQDGGMKHHVAD